MPRYAIGDRVRILSNPYNDIVGWDPDDTRVSDNVYGQVGIITSVDEEDTTDSDRTLQDSYLVAFDVAFPFYSVYVDYDGDSDYVVREHDGSSREFWFYEDQVTLLENSFAAKDWPPSEPRKRYKDMQTVELP